MLKFLPLYADASIVRTRKPENLEKCSIVVDVGAVYDSDTLKFDHHQRTFTDTLPNYNTKLSSAGLIYKHYGKDIIKAIITSIDPNTNIDEMTLTIFYHKIYENFIEHIDAIDNGIAVSDGDIKYHISSTLSSRVGTLNPAWNEVQTPQLYNTRFQEAMSLTAKEFSDNVISLYKHWWPARTIIKDALADRFKIHESGKIIILDTICPWKDHLFELEKTDSCVGDIIYALYEDSGGSWRIQAVPVTSTSFESRKKLPTDWRGIRNEELDALTNGPPGAIFIHASGFIGGHKTKEGALAMAITSLTLA